MNATQAKQKILDSLGRQLDIVRRRQAPDNASSADQAALGRAFEAEYARGAQATREYHDAAMSEAATLRAEAASSRDPMARAADELERARLVTGPLDASVFVMRANEAARAGQLDRAEFMLDIARQKGADELSTHDLRAYLAVALDEKVPERRSAREIEATLERDALDFERRRLQVAKIAGFGVKPDGTLGDGSPTDVTSANATAKLLDYLAKTERGEEYVDPMDGMNFELGKYPPRGTLPA